MVGLTTISDHSLAGSKQPDTLRAPLWALENLASGKVVNQISVDERTRQYAKVSLDRMLVLQ